MKRALAAVLLVLSLLAAGASAPVAADSHGNSTDAEFTLEELRRGGQQISGAPPSLRWIGQDSGVWVDYTDPNPLQDTGGSDWSAKTLLKPGTTVPRNEIRLHRQGTQATADETLTVHIVYWETGPRTVRGERTTSEETVVENVTHTTQEVQFDGAFDVATIDLRPHYDRPRQVTMWVEGSEQTARWRFRHKSLESTRALPAWVDSRGDLLLWTAQNVLLPMFVAMLVLAGLVMWGRKRAAAGPQNGYVWWIFVIALGALFATAAAWQWFSSIFVQAPAILAVTAAAIAMVPVVESQDESVRDVLTIKPEVTDATTAGGEMGKDILRMESKGIKLADTPQGETLVLRPGILAYLSRLLGGGAVLKEQIDTTVAVHRHPKYDEAIWVDPQREKPIRYKREGIKLWDPPTRLKGGAVGLAIVALGGLATATWVGTAIPGAVLAALPIVMSVRKGEAEIHPAPMHFRAAHTTALFLSEEADQAATMEQALEEAYEERASVHTKIEERSDHRDSSLVESTVGVEIDAAVGSRNETDGLTDDQEEPEDGANAAERAVDAITGGDGDDE
jgi:hypothetical protein